MNNYLIPANSKKSLLIFSTFTKFDLLLFGTGLFVTTIMLLIIKTETLGTVCLVLAPACITGFLVMPVPNYHNIFTILQNVIIFFTNNQKYKWKGWCFLNEKE